jgi:UDP-N-acetylglucosamine 2-epimerase (hydrolysing)
MLAEYGETYKEIVADGHKNIYIARNLNLTLKMDVDLANTILSLNLFITNNRPDLIVVHGDRIDALAGGICGMLNNIPVAHIEGGEVTGSVDESIRHAISKMANYHFVSNYESKLRIMQLGEKEENIYTIGSPDIDIMLSCLPDLATVKAKYNINFNRYAICIYHPVTTEYHDIDHKAKIVFEAVNDSSLNYIIIYPNNDLGSSFIIDKIKNMQSNDVIAFKSLAFEDFLCLLKHSSFIMGNSSAGIREACVYGIPAIDIGTRQSGRYDKRLLRNIQAINEDKAAILNCIAEVDKYRFTSNYFGRGDSAKLFTQILLNSTVSLTQKKFVDLDQTQSAIDNYINEVCF